MTLELEINPEQPADATKKIPYPKCVVLILSNEICERFTYYGLRSILILYFTSMLNFSQQKATICYHAFVFLCYITPLMGGYISDNWLGKFNTTFFVSLIYAAGNVLLCLTAAPLGLTKIPMTLLSLMLIGIGTGGIKPCVAAFGGDQFILPQQEKQLEGYFFVFYFCINVGSALSTGITPLLRDRGCFGEDTCFPLAFGVSALLMILSIVVFVVGKPQYKIIPVKGPILTRVFKCIGVGLNKVCDHPKGERVEHWLDRAEEQYHITLITDIKKCLVISLLLFPGPAFWALFDQSASTWTFQACRMNGIVGSFTIHPDQMQMINPVLILVMIPMFSNCIYPVLLKIGLLKKQISRMCCGGFLLVIAFAMVSAVSLYLERDDPDLPKAGASHLRVYNALRCTPTITSSVFDAPTQIDSMDFKMTEVHNVEGENTYEWTVANCDDFPEKTGTFSLEEKKSIGYYLSKKGMMRFEDDVSKDEKMNGYPNLRVLVDDPAINMNLEIKYYMGERAELKNKKTGKRVNPSLNETSLHTVRPGMIQILGSSDDEILHVKQGAVYVIFIETENQSVGDLIMIEVTPPNKIHVFWQLPQYIIVTAAEIMFNVSGLEFAYAQAPATMKSFVQALWLMTNAFGNIGTCIFEGVNVFNSKSTDNIFFTVLMFVVMIIFVFMCKKYHYIER